MKVFFLIILLASGAFKLTAQDSAVSKIHSDSNVLPERNFTQKRIKLIAGGNIAGYGGTMAALYATWYKNYPQSNFHFFNDNKEWLQVDKAGHLWSAYTEGRAGIEMGRTTTQKGYLDRRVKWFSLSICN